MNMLQCTSASGTHPTGLRGATVSAERLIRHPAQPSPANNEQFPKLLFPEALEALPLEASPLESPSVFIGPSKDIQAFEVKFLLNEDQAREVIQRVGSRLDLDAHADPSLDNAYRTTSLY